VTIQLLREWPPGYGGVERVAHELAVAWGAMGCEVRTYCLQRPGRPPVADPLPVNYHRLPLPRLAFGQLLLPLPSRQLIRLLLSRDPLHVHLPCPALLAVSVLARVLRPHRMIRLHWHAFLDAGAGPGGSLVAVYQWLALRWAAVEADQVVTTSPVLATALLAEGVKPQCLVLLPCCLGEFQEHQADAAWERRVARGPRQDGDPFRLLYVGRLDSYKRVEWLIAAFPASGAEVLHIVGDGPRRRELEVLAASSSHGGHVIFHGRLSERQKQHLLETSDLLVLPADRSNEAFGIVQLEAMACGVPALAFDRERSGTAWVSNLASVFGRPHVRPEDLPQILASLVQDPDLWGRSSAAARQRFTLMFSRRVWKHQLEAMWP
jgi:glycosyltransferase involved in cell wall biosynthesis